MGVALKAASFKLLLALLVAVWAAGHGRAAESGVRFLHVEEINGVSKWQLFPYLWTETTLNITCDGIKDFNVYVAKDRESLMGKFEEQERAWCGWGWFVGTQRDSCITRLSPFGSTYVAVGRPKSARTPGGVSCRLLTSQQTDWRLLAQGVAGTLLFLFAPALSTSTPFRLGIGTTAFTTASVLLVALFILYRVVPDKRKVAAGFMVFGSGVMTFGRWMFGTWIPSTAQLMHSKLVWGYLALSALAGLGVTYYFDNPANAKLNTILRVAMQLMGLAAVALSTTLPEASMTLAALLVASQALPLVHAWALGSRSPIAFVARAVGRAVGAVRWLLGWRPALTGGKEEEDRLAGGCSWGTAGRSCGCVARTQLHSCSTRWH